MGPLMESFAVGSQKVASGFRFGLQNIHPNLCKYPNVTKEKFQKQLDEHFERCTKHIVQITGAVTAGLLAYSKEFDKNLNATPDLANEYKVAEQFHQEQMANTKDVEKQHRIIQW